MKPLTEFTEEDVEALLVYLGIDPAPFAELNITGERPEHPRPRPFELFNSARERGSMFPMQPNESSPCGWHAADDVAGEIMAELEDDDFTEELGVSPHHMVKLRAAMADRGVSSPQAEPVGDDEEI